MNKTSISTLSRSLCFFVALLLYFLSASRASASPTARWNVNDYKSFSKGDSEGAVVTSLGEVRTGWSAQQTELGFDNVWASALAADGTMYLGSDDKATIYKLVDTKVTKLAVIGSSVAVVSLALSADGSSLYAGTMPDGEVWRVNTGSGEARKLAKLDKSETVWSLALAGQDLYAGTGPEGLLYKVDTKSGRTALAFDSEDKRIMSLLTAGDGGIWLGTSDNALLFRYDPKTDKTRAVADFAGNEVSALAERRGMIIAAASELAPAKSAGMGSKQAVEKAAKKPPSGQAAKMPTKGSKPGADAPENGAIKPVAKSVRKGKGALYQVRGDGQLTQLHALNSSYFTSVAVDEKGKIFAGAADKGRIYLIESEDEVSTAIDVDQRYIAHLHVGQNGAIRFTTGDSTAVYRSDKAATRSLYTSEVFDAKSPARFGGLRWRGSGKLAFETRSGNTQKPGVGWSGWTATTSVVRSIGNSGSAQVESPPARYIQYRVHLGSLQSKLRSTSLFYLPSNRATSILDVTIGPSSSRRGVTTENTPAARSPILDVKWQVRNDDSDKTAYIVEVRPEGTVRWRSIQGESKPLTSASYKWNTESYSDGYYRLRVTASDRLANAEARALVSHKITPIFVLDNERPKLSGVSVRYPKVSARASDALSIISEVAYSIDNSPWQLVGTRDGIFDSQTELVEITLPSEVPSGTHSLAIRVLDSAGNLGGTTTSFLKN